MEGTERWSNLLIWAKVQTELWLGCSGKEELVWAAGWALLYNSGPESLWFFYFCFLQKYIFVFEIYMNVPRAAGPPPLYKGVGCPSPSFALLKIQKKEKR